MSRLVPVADGQAGLVPRIAFWLSRRTLRRKLGVPAVPTPMRVMAHNANVLQGFGMSEQFLARSRTLPRRLQGLIRETVAAMVGCHW